MKKNQSGFTVVALITVVVVVGLLAASFVVIRNRAQELDASNEKTAGKMAEEVSSEVPQPYPVTADWDTVRLTRADQQRKLDIQSLSMELVAYEVMNKVDPPDAAAANAFHMAKDPLKDPDTGQPYTIVDGEPGLGQMQYRRSASCDNNNRVFMAENSLKISALRVRLSEGSFICKSDIN
jgi:hypothetical protein